MSTLRNRTRPASSLEERLLKFAEEARTAAELIAPGPEQDVLLRKAATAETASRRGRTTCLTVPLELPRSPIMLLGIGIKRYHDVTV